MTARVKLRLGNLFDGPADLIILPCSTSGTITSFVASALVNYSIPLPRNNMALGAVDVHPFKGAQKIAQFVAYAASVRGHSSSIEAIESIGREIGKFTQSNPGVRQVSAPLLGAGAGGLQSEAVVAALRSGFTQSAAEDATLIIHVLQDALYERLKQNRPVAGRPREKEAPRVFISHTSKTKPSEEWVETLATFLLEQGIQARLDRFHLRRGMDLPQWMCNELALAHKVIVICDEAYKQKADGRLGGVGWETMIIQGDMATLPPESTKYQIVVRAADIERGLPMYLRTKFAFHAPGSDLEESFREELLKELLDLSKVPATNLAEFSV